MKRAEFIEKWLEALESGKYRQAKGALIKRQSIGNSYCCLGVACELKELDFDKDTDGQLLPGKLARFMGMSTDGGFCHYVEHGKKSYRSLADLNDSGVRFKTIARIIREQMAAGNFQKP